MANEMRRLSQIIYTRLLRLYPKQFRERFGESMQQTFEDVSKEEGRSKTLHTLVDTGMGAFREQMLLLSTRRIMNGLSENPRAAAIIGVLLILPGLALLSSLMFNIEPPLGPLKPIVEGPQEGPHVLGSLIALTIILVLPTLGLMINMSSIRTAFLAAPNLLIAGGLGLMLVVPFIVLELVNTQGSDSDFPLPLFGILWLLASAFLAILMPIAQRLLSGTDAKIRPTTLVLGAVVLVIIASMWGGIVIDQMPCFLGVPNCD